MRLPPETPPVRTTCPYCGVGCGVLARSDGRGGAEIQGDPNHPANFGRLCSKGSALGETLSLEGRLLSPQLRGNDGKFVQVSWDEALDRLAAAFRQTLGRYGPEAIALYVSGQLLTEDYYVANKLMKGFLGSANIDTNSRLCMSSAVAAHTRAFGSDTVPGCYEDVDLARLLVLVGSNAAWCHPVLFQRISKNRKERAARLVVIDPRRTATANDCDLFLPIAPGTDTLLFSGLLSHLAATGALDRAFIRDHTLGFAEALARARHLAPDTGTVAAGCGLAHEDVARFFSWFQETPQTVTLFSQGVNQSAQGTDKANAILNCHLATGRIGRDGMGPFSLTGQPNAMGGREVGGLANQLAAHMAFTPRSLDRVRRFWQAPCMAQREGLKAVDLFEAVAAGRIKALWIVATNPAVSLPRADAVAGALATLDFLAVSENAASNDVITQGAHVLLPAAAWGEKDGTVTNSERRISRQRAFLPLPGEAKPDWWIISEVAKRLGFEAAFSYTSPAEIFREHAALSAFENAGERDFNLEGFAEITPEEYDALEPVQWPVRKKGAGGTTRLFTDGRFFTECGRARFTAVAPPRLSAPPEPHFPILLNTGRMRDQWHTMTRTGKSPRLSAHCEEPFVSVHPADARRASLEEGGFARVASRHGEVILRVHIDEGQREGETFAPIHWTGETASLARIGALIPGACDPFSGQPELKAAPVRLSPVSFAGEGFLLARGFTPPPTGTWWARVAVEGGHGLRIATPLREEAWPAFALSLLGRGAPTLEYRDEGLGLYRAAWITDGRLAACLFLARARAHLPSWEWLKKQFAAPHLDETVRRALLAGRPAAGRLEGGAVVCACFGVSQGEIRRFIAANAPGGIEAIGQTLRAGTNCGSCLPELRRLIAAARTGKTAALTPETSAPP